MQFAYLKRYTNFGKKKLYFEVRHHQCLTDKDISQHTLRQAALNLSTLTIKSSPFYLLCNKDFSSELSTLSNLLWIQVDSLESFVLTKKKTG